MRFKLFGFKIHSSLVLGAAALLCLAAYVSLHSPVFGVAAVALLVVAVAVDLLFSGEGEGARAGGKNSRKPRGEWKRLAIEVGATIAVAVAAWLALCVALQTSSPLNVVTSCSMLPSLERGDFVVLQGGGVNAFEASVPFRLRNAFTQSVALDARGQGKRYYLTYSTFLVDEDGEPGSFANYSFADCVRVPLGSSANAASAATAASGELQACASGASVNGVFFDARDNENDVVVYEAQPAQYGLVIHRVLARLRAPDGVVYLTKVDNNQFADQQLGISVVPESAVKGRVIGRIPFVGYFKLLLFGQFEFPPGCDSTLRYLN
jgi:hypothetical protein